MAGRNYLHQVGPMRHSMDEPGMPRHLPVYIGANHAAMMASRQATALEERIALQRHEIQSLFTDNQRLATAHVSLKQEFDIAQSELVRLSAEAANINTQKDALCQEAYDRSRNLESEVLLLDEVRVEVAQVKEDIQKLSSQVKDMTAQLMAVNDDLAKARLEGNQVSAIKSQIEIMQKEVQKGRAAIDYEKKVQASNQEHSQAMKKNMVAMSQEVEKLQGELANAEKRARAAVAAAVAANPSPGYAGGYANPFHDSYAIMHQGHGGMNGPGATANGGYHLHQPDSNLRKSDSFLF